MMHASNMDNSLLQKLKKQQIPTSTQIESDLLKFSQNGSNSQVEYLFDKFYKNPGFNVNCRDSYGNTALILAAKRGHGRIVEFLLFYTPDITLENSRGETVLHVGSMSVLQAVMGSSTALITGSTVSEATASTMLCNSVWLGNATAVQKILSNMINGGLLVPPRLPTNLDGISCLHLAVTHLGLVEKVALKTKNVNKPSLVLQSLLNHCSHEPQIQTAYSILHLLANSTAKSATELTKIVLDRKFDPLARDLHGFTPIHYAARSGNNAVLEMLLRQCSLTMIGPYFLDVVGTAGNTPLHLAALAGREMCVKTLLKYGANKNVCNSHNISPKEMARNQKIKMILTCNRLQLDITGATASSSSGASISKSALALQRSNTTVSPALLTQRPLTQRQSSAVVIPKSESVPINILSKSTSTIDFKRSPSNPKPLPSISDNKFNVPLWKWEEFTVTKRAVSNPTLTEKRSSVEKVDLIISQSTGSRSMEPKLLQPILTLDEKTKKPNSKVKLKKGTNITDSNKLTQKIVQSQNPPDVRRRQFKIDKSNKKIKRKVKKELYKDDFESDTDTVENNLDDDDFDNVRVEEIENENSDLLEVEKDDLKVETFENVFDSDNNLEEEEEEEEEEGVYDENMLTYRLSSNETEPDYQSFNLNSERKVSSFVSDKFSNFDKIQRGSLLGKGGYGKVYKVLLEDGQFCVVKEIEVKKVDLLSEHSRSNIREIKREINILLTMKHQNIVQCYGIESNDNFVHIFMELVSGGSIAELVKEFALSETTVRIYTRQLVSAVNFLHRNGIAHRDIKGANVMVTVEGAVKLIDFGCAKKCFSNDSMSLGRGKSGDAQLTCHMGSLHWTAPEVMCNQNIGYSSAGSPDDAGAVEGCNNESAGINDNNNNNDNNDKSTSAAAALSDVWSLGCTVHEMVTRYPPLHERSPFNLVYILCSTTKVVSSISTNQTTSSPCNDSPTKIIPSLCGKLFPPNNAPVSIQLSNFIDNCLTIEPTLRPTTSDLLLSPFLKGN